MQSHPSMFYFRASAFFLGGWGARSNTTREGDRQLLRLRRHWLRTQNKQRPAEHIHTNERVQNRPGLYLFQRWERCGSVRAEQIRSFALIVSLIFADVLPLALQPPTPSPHLFSFHQQDFKAHFVSSATVPPFPPPSLPPIPSSHISRSNQVPQLEVKSLAIPPPWFWPPIPSVATSKLSATPSASCRPLLRFIVLAHLLPFVVIKDLILDRQMYSGSFNSS